MSRLENPLTKNGSHEAIKAVKIKPNKSVACRSLIFNSLRRFSVLFLDSQPSSIFSKLIDIHLLRFVYALLICKMLQIK